MAFFSPFLKAKDYGVISWANELSLLRRNLLIWKMEVKKNAHPRATVKMNEKKHKKRLTAVVFSSVAFIPVFSFKP